MALNLRVGQTVYFDDGFGPSPSGLAVYSGEVVSSDDYTVCISFRGAVIFKKSCDVRRKP